MALPRKRLEKGKSVGAQVGKAFLKAGLRSVPGAGAVMGVADIAGAMGIGGKAASGQKRRSRTRGMYMRKGRVFMGFSQKDVKNAMRRAYGGRTRRK